MLVSGYMDITPTSRSTGRQPEPAAVFRALADDTRLRIIQLLLLEELNVSELVEVLGIPQSSMSRQLKVLRDAGLIRDRRVGVTALCSTVIQRSASTSVHSDDPLASVLLTWLAERPLPRSFHERLRRVVARRALVAPSFFNRIGRRWDDLRNAAFGTTFATEAFVSLLPADWTVADIGTGTGHLLPMLAARFNRVLAIEPADAMLECARGRIAQSRSTNVELRQGDLTHLPIADSEADLAIAMLVLHHVDSPDEALRELRRIIRPGGRILIVEQEAHENQSFYERMQDRWWGFDAADLTRRLTATGCEAAHVHSLVTASREGSVDAPPLFALTATRSP